MNQPNIYGLYAANGNAAGFWVRRDSWSGSTFARILTVGGQSAGPLSGKPPYHDNPPVIAAFYLHGKLKDPNMVLSCPGTYAYTQIPLPAGV
jgi:hypothetical protein